MSWEFESLICSVGLAATCGAVVTLAGTPALLRNYMTERKELKLSRSPNTAVFGGGHTGNIRSINYQLALVPVWQLA